MKGIKTNMKKYAKIALVIGAAYVAGRVTCFFDVVEKYQDKLTVDHAEMGLFGPKCKFAGMGWDRPEK